MRPFFAATLGAVLVFASAKRARAESGPGDLDPALLPLVGGDSDFGLGLGVLASLARLGDPVTTKRWVLAVTAVQTFKVEEGEIVSPFQDYILRFSTYELPVPGARLVFDANYTHSHLYYPGLGNASDPDWQGEESRYQRRSLLLHVSLRVPLGASFFHESGVGFTHNEAVYADDSRIARDQASPDEVVREGALLPRSHGVPLFVQALGWDSRDADVRTSKGFMHRVAVRVAPGNDTYFATPYVGVSAQFRGYHTLVRDRWVLAWRALGDVLLGDPPTYELGRHEKGWAIGGVDGLRGVPAQRYYGAVKGLATLENRFWLAKFSLFGQSMQLGAAAFADVGRVFATTAERLDLDGPGHGLKYGLGGGPRLAQGRQFEARLDVAYSPDAKPVGIYVGAGQAF